MQDVAAGELEAAGVVEVVFELEGVWDFQNTWLLFQFVDNPLHY